MKKQIIFLVVLFSALCLGSSAFGAIIVGRIAHVEGQIYRYMNVDQSWAETYLESPAGTQDVLATGANSRAEFVFPNNFLVRLDENAEIEILELAENVGVFTLPKGMARFYNQSAEGSLRVETVMGTAKVGPGSAVDMLVEGNTVVVSAVHGKVTFQSFENGGEKQEVISGSTSLEFQEESIVAGRSPIDRNWDRWCIDREKFWARNRLIRSKYLPETMQEHAFVLESSGMWRRIYYRGYYYWAWQPRYVAAGWTPYTTGYWYEWHGGPVWVDQNPWGWVTHHHGHWLHKHGAWMWTPYIHVSSAPGVTAVGFNIIFGRAYRPYWHPGRVRWIAHSGHIGWLPLAPRETYYGYRRWGPRSVVVKGGLGFSININLAHHRYVDHAVVIPKRHFYQRGGRRNNYNTVKIANIHKMIIVNNYKPVAAVEEQKTKRHAAKVTQAGKLRGRVTVQPERRKIKRKEIVNIGKQTRKNDLATQARKNEQKVRVVGNRRQNTAKEATEKVVKRRNVAMKVERQKKVARSERRVLVEKSEKPTKTAEKRSVAAMNKLKRDNDNEASGKKKDNVVRQDVVQASNRISKRQQDKAAAVKKYGFNERKQVQKQTRIAQKQLVHKNLNQSSRIYKENSRKYDGAERSKVTREEKQAARAQQYHTPKGTFPEHRGDRQRILGPYDSASLNKRHSRE
jgi:hypothetical protein